MTKLGWWFWAVTVLCGCSAAGPESDDVGEGEASRDDAVGVDYPLPPIPAACTLKAKVNIYAPRGSDRLVDALEAHVTPCADYFIHEPALVADKTKPRGPKAPQSVRARKGRFHAVAEFHFGAWSEVGNMTWYEKGVEFRKRMEAAGYNIERGDTWAINELPSTTKKSATTRAHIRNLISGLYHGPSGAKHRAGVVYVIGMGEKTTNLGPYKGMLEDWLDDDAFWNQMNEHVLYWGQETFADPHTVCVGGATVAEKAERINAFTMHPARLAAAGMPATSAARAFFNVSYFPLLAGVWKNDAYGNTHITLDNMKQFVSHQVYATRAWANDHLVPDGRIGFAWDDNVDGASAEQIDALAKRLAHAIGDAYAIDGRAPRACSPSGAYTLCQCDVSGAEFNDAWKTFESW